MRRARPNRPIAKTTEHYVLIDIEPQLSRFGNTMWRLTFHCIEDGRDYEMTVADNFDNFRDQGWDHVVTHDQPWGIYTNLHRTSRRSDSGAQVLTADFEAEMYHRLDSQGEAQELAELNRVEHRQGLYNRLFDHV